MANVRYNNRSGSLTNCLDQKERSNMIKIKVSYERPEELRKVLERLNPYVKSWKASRDQKGHFLKAYIIME